MIQTVARSLGWLILRVAGATAGMLAWFVFFLAYPISPTSLFLALLFGGFAVSGSELAAFVVRQAAGRLA